MAGYHDPGTQEVVSTAQTRRDLERDTGGTSSELSATHILGRIEKSGRGGFARRAAVPEPTDLRLFKAGGKFYREAPAEPIRLSHARGLGILAAGANW